MVSSSGPAVRKLSLFLNSLRNNIRGEVVYRIFKWTLLMELLSDNPGGRVPRIGNIGAEVNCLAKAVSISTLRVRDQEKR